MIEFRNVYFSYNGKRYVLKNVSLEIKRGEAVAVIGENGAGKTTLLKHLNGLLKPTKGAVLVGGKDTRKCSVAELSRTVGLIFQNPNHQLFAETVWDEVAFALRNFNYPSDVIRKRVEYVLRLFDLYEYKDRSPYELSGGERKRLAIASVLAYDPEVIAFDEPTIGQDYYQKQTLGQYIKLLKTQGKTIVTVTHDMEFVAENFEKVVLLSRGEVVACGSAREVLTNKSLLEKHGLLAPQLTELAYELSDYGFPRDILTLEEAYRAIKRVLEV